MTKRKSSPPNWQAKLPLFLGLGIPLFLMVYLFVFVYLPSLRIKPQFSFVYASECRYLYTFSVDNRVLKYSLSDRYADPSKVEAPDCLYKFDAQSKRSQKISLSEASSLRYNSNSTSPDGFYLQKSQEEGPSYFPFFESGRADVYYLKGHGLNQKVTNKTYDYDFQFVGWIE